MNHTSKTPPPFGLRMLSRLIGRERNYGLCGDLEEFYCIQKEIRGGPAANLILWLQILRAVPLYFADRFYWSCIMLRNYLKIAFRTLKRRKTYTLINIAGLAAGLACCMTILLYVSSESSYDRYHRDVDRLYRVVEYRKVPAGEFCMAQVSPMVATVLRENYSQVEEAARIFPVSNILVEQGQRRAFEDRVSYTESSLFDILSIPFVSGGPTWSGSALLSL